VFPDDEEDEEEGDPPPGDTAGALHVAIVVARSRVELDSMLAALATGTLAAAGAALVLLGLGGWWSIHRGLAPLGRLGREVERVEAASLSTRLATDGIPAELGPFVTKLNELFERLEASFAKERRMTSAMAHELRTPIAELRSASDVARRWPDDDALVDEAVAAAADVAVRMSRAVDAVMRYCRLESGQAVLETETVYLRAQVEEAWRRSEPAALHRGLAFRNEVPDDLAVRSDGGLLALVFGNLLDNAASFASGGTIVARAQTGADSITVSVSNRADQLEFADLARVSEPFWRKDAARTDGMHSGLGLTLVTSVLRVLGGEARFDLVGGRFVASIRIPAAPHVPENGRQLSAGRGVAATP
jgi:two-component system sensor histidine kinase QseC